MVFGTLSRGWQLIKVSWGVIRQDKELLVLPVLAGITTIFAWVLFFASIFLFFPVLIFGGQNVALLALLVFVMYLVSFFIAYFFQAAVVGAATIRLNGGDPTVGDGLRIAAANVGRILVWAAVNATVGLILRALAERGGLLGQIAAAIAGAAWNVVTYFVLPVLIFEKLSTWKAIKRSGQLLRSTWGEMFVSGLGIGLIFMLLGFAAVLGAVALGSALGGFGGLAAGGIVAVVALVILGVLSSTMHSVLLAALYRYATTGQLVPGYPVDLFRRPWAASPRGPAQPY